MSDTKRNVYIGMKAGQLCFVGANTVEAFARVSGDDNPLHVDPEYAARTPFKGCIAHGMLAASYISALLAKSLPGPGTIYLSQELRFLKPIRVRTMVTVEVELVEQLKPDLFKLRTRVLDEYQDVAVEGTAVVKNTHVRLVAPEQERPLHVAGTA